MGLHPSHAEYLQPTDYQKFRMAVVRKATADYIAVLEEEIPDGPDRTYAIRKAREVAMWCNVAITRNADGSPRE